MVYGYIYKIENLINGKIYIGQTTLNPPKRRNIHFYELRKKKHGNKHLQNSFNKYGEANFKFTVLNYATDKKTLDQLEITYINYYDCLDMSKGYNLQSGGSHGKHSPETIEKMKRNCSYYWLGKSRSEETKTKISKNNPMYKLENREKIRNARIGKKHSLETRKKISKSHLGKKVKGEHLKNLRSSKRGKGLFGFTGGWFRRTHNPEKKCWQANIYFKKYKTPLGYFQDPLSCEIVHDLVLDAVRGDIM